MKRNLKIQVIRSLLGPKKYVIVVEHDLAVLDYLSDFVCCLYGKPGAYGVVTLPFSVREGINVFLAGFVPTENLRFREEALSFKVAVDTSESESAVAAASAAATAAAASSKKGGKGKEKEKAGAGDDDEATTAVVGGKRYSRFTYPAMTKTQGSFKLTVESGDFTDSEIIVMLGENGTGKTTLIRMLGGLLPPDEEDGLELPQFGVSYKPQKISPKFPGTVRELLHKRIRDAYLHPQFVSDVMRPLLMEPLMDQAVLNLSGGELQRVAITLALGVPADIYLIDEPSAYLDSEQRIVAAKVIKRFIMHAKKTAFIVEHDFIMVSFKLFCFFSGQEEQGQKKKNSKGKKIQLFPPPNQLNNYRPPTSPTASSSTTASPPSALRHTGRSPSSRA